jgi:hypothetical protein
VVVVLLAGGAAFALSRDSDSDSDSGSTSTSTSGETETIAVTDCPPTDQPSVCIVGVTNWNGTIEAEFTRQGDVELERSEDAAHAQFFFEDDPWNTQIWGSESPFAWEGQVEVTTPRQMCVVVIDANGAELPESGNCVEVPTA